MDYRSDYMKSGQGYGDSVHRFFSTQDRPDLPLSPSDAWAGKWLASLPRGLGAGGQLFMSRAAYVQTQMDLHPFVTREAIEAELYANTELEALQAEFAGRKTYRTCEDCEEEPLIDHVPERSLDWNESRVRCYRADLIEAGFEEMPHNAGLVRRCEDCRDHPKTYEWIADIPFVDFKNFMGARSGAFDLDLLRSVLPPSRMEGALSFFKQKYGTFIDSVPAEATLAQPYRCVVLTSILGNGKPAELDEDGRNPKSTGFEFL